MFYKYFEFLQWLHSGGKDLDEIAKEHHSFWLGWCEVICFGKKPIHPMPMEYPNPLKNEWHYYRLGMAAGVFTWLGIAFFVVIHFNSL